MKDFPSDEMDLLKVVLREKPTSQEAKKKELPAAFSTVATWKRELEKNLHSTSALPVVTKGGFQDAERLL